VNPRISAAVWGTAVTAAQVLSALSVRDRLPDPLATHWGGGPDRHMSFALYVLSSALTWAVLWVVLLATVSRVRTRRMARSWWWGALFGGGTLMLGVHACVLAANLDRPVWSEARMPVWYVPLAVAAAFGVAVLAGYLGRGEPEPLPPVATAPPLRLRPGLRTVWVSRVANPWLIRLAMAAGCGGAALWALERAGTLSPDVADRLLRACVILLIIGTLASTLSVRVGVGGLAIGFGPVGWPVRRIPLSKIDRAWSEERYPSQVGGWGFRGLPGMSTIMLRGGECLVIGYRSGGRLAISIDDAERGASLINALIAERAEP
jgi:hypothetical protein